MINVIFGASDLNGCTKSAVKKKMWEAMRVHSVSTDPAKPTLTISFTEAAAVVEEPYYDALVMQITISNLNIQKVLIDTRSSANILFLSTLKVM